MIIWLASYPRSGNTLLRLMLKRVWGCHSYSVYDDRADIGADDEVSEAVGHQFLPAPWPVAYEQMKASAETFFVKTHDIPIDAGKAIYVVRDGRMASRSFSHYLNDFARTHDEQLFSLAEVIMGMTPFGSWSNHLDGWNPPERPDTLLLKFEDLVNQPQAQIQRIGEFLQLPPLEDWQNQFVELNQRNPKFFRAGSANSPSAQMEPADHELFWLVHGTWMRRLGYAGQDDPDPAAAMHHASRQSIHGAICNLQAKVRIAHGRETAARSAHEVLAQELDAVRLEMEKLRADNAQTFNRLTQLENHMQQLSHSRAIRVISALHLSPKLELSENSRQ
jgi:hypothetical protein